MRNFWRVLLLGVLLAILPAGCSQEKQLVLQDADTKKVYARWTVAEAETFSLEFIHSVNQSPIIDVFAVHGGRIRPVRTIYTSLGAGVQSELLPGETLSYDEDGRMVITGFQQEFESLNLIVGTVSDHQLTIQDKIYSLRDLCGKNAAVTFTIDP